MQITKKQNFQNDRKKNGKSESIIVIKEIKSVIQTSYKETSGSDVFYQLFKKENRP